jgi:spore maturation protein CgeB
MKFVFFCHAISSCWNNGNAHFLRGVTRELVNLGHQVAVYEPDDGWSRLNATRDGGEGALAGTSALMPGVDIRGYLEFTLDLDKALDAADVVVVHEWTPEWLVEELGTRRASGAAFRLLFHDTHHRAVTAPEQIDEGHLDGFDGALVFGEALREVYLKRGLAHRVFTWHEAADTALFKPLAGAGKNCDLIWIGNWGDEERSAELSEFLIEPAARLRLATQIYGVRYPEHAQALLRAHNVDYRGWLPNHKAPAAFAQARVTVHVPRGPYVRALPGIPTIRVFEALACGIPLVCSPWSDCEGLFPPGCYLSAASGTEMSEALADILNNDDFASDLVTKGLRAIHEAHTCRHRAVQLVEIVEQLSNSNSATIREPAQAQAAYP